MSKNYLIFSFLFIYTIDLQFLNCCSDQLFISENMYVKLINPNMTVA